MTRRLPSPSLAVSITALVVAMGGTGYAATKLSGSNIKAGTITGKQVKKHSLPAGKLSPKAIAALRGAQGPAGPAGPAGSLLVGGGAKPSAANPYIVVDDSYPDSADTWVADVSNTSGNSITFTTRAICLVQYSDGQPPQIASRPGF